MAMSVPAIRNKLYRMRGNVWPALGALLIVPGAAGVFAGGDLHLEQATGLSIEVAYYTEVHRALPTEWQVTLLKKHSATGRYQLRFDEKDFKKFKVESVSPEPLEVRRESGELIFVFGGNATTTRFAVLPTSVGKESVTVQYGVDTPVAFLVTTLP